MEPSEKTIDDELIVFLKGEILSCMTNMSLLEKQYINFLFEIVKLFIDLTTLRTVFATYQPKQQYMQCVLKKNNIHTASTIFTGTTISPISQHLYVTGYALLPQRHLSS